MTRVALIERYVQQELANMDYTNMQALALRGLHAEAEGKSDGELRGASGEVARDVVG